MIKIATLNEELEEESRCEEDVTKEALEQIALQQYTKALDLQKKGKLTDATKLLKDLLETELLDEIKKPGPGEKITTPLYNLKYLCYKNLGSMLFTAGEVNAAINAYCSASDLDNTDITLWYRLGLACLRAKRYEMALHAFSQGLKRNPKHWPCLDNTVTLLLGLDYKEECISMIYETLQLDPDYLRGLIYRRYIYKTYPYIRDYMEYLNPIYKWNETNNEFINEDQASKLLKEAEEIHSSYLEQQRADQFKCSIPNLKLVKPISKLSWESVGESLTCMHHYMTENAYSHASYIELVFEKSKVEEKIEESTETKPETLEAKSEDEKSDTDKSKENGHNKEITEKPMEEKMDIDPDGAPSDQATEVQAETKPKKTQVRRRASALSYLEQWEWCKTRRSGRKKPANRQDDNIYDILRRMVPISLVPENVEKSENSEDKSKPTENCSVAENNVQTNDANMKEYFGSESEQKDVKQFIQKFSECKCDIIDLLREYLGQLASKWKVLWPEKLPKIFIEANKCYNTHIDVPLYNDDRQDELYHYITVNLLIEEFIVNEKLLSSERKQSHELDVAESIGVTLSLKPHIFSGTELLELVLRQLWLKHHISLLLKCDEMGLDCLYQLISEFEAMGEHKSCYNLNIVNFTFKPILNEEAILEYIKFLERNKKLSSVMDLYDRGNYEEVLSVVMDSFEYCKKMAKKEEEDMSLDFAIQLSLLLDTLWALDRVECCLKWSLICLHEALKHYFRYTSGSADYEKWTLTVVKILCSMEHILTTEGLVCLDSVSRQELSQGLEDLIRIIGHQVETNAAEMPFGTVLPWIVMHFIMQREEDQGRGKTPSDAENTSECDIPNPLMVLFIAHEQLGNRSWCCHSDGKLLYFILDTVVPRLRSPYLSKCLELVCQHMEQCVFCLYGHPGRKTKLKYLVDHGVTPQTLDWKRAQQVYEIYRPPTLPALEGKISGISCDTEQLFLRILELLPKECEPQKYVVEIEKYIKGTEDKLPNVPPLLPFKMKDIYFLLGDYYFKKEDGKTAIKYNLLDVVVNNNRLESWAEISLAKAMNLERLLDSCKNLNNEREFLNPAKSTIRCFKRALELDPGHCNMWIEYGMFVYIVHSFCSRLLKQASESLSMENFEFIEKQKEDMLDTTHKCFSTILENMNNTDDEKANEDSWLHYYMLGKVAEKRNKPPSVYLDYYMRGVKRLQEADATYPLKINYSSPTHLCIEVLELHYRIHASILKYIEQHENKPIPASVGKVFSACIEQWKVGPFNKKLKKDGTLDTDNEAKGNGPFQAANILKRSASDAGEDDTKETKRMKLEAAAAKIKRSSSYDTERLISKDQSSQNAKSPIPMIEQKDTNDDEKLKDYQIRRASGGSSPDKNPKSNNDKKSETKRKRESVTSSSSTSSSDSSSSDSSSDTSDTSKESNTSARAVDATPLADDEIMKIVSACLDALEDCASRFPPHYKAIYRLAHYHFYYKKGKDIERCRDLMLSNFTSRNGQKIGGLFSERKQHNFFNNIWKIPLCEVDRAGGFAFHMNRSVLLTMEILKEIDDHKTLLDLSLHLQRIPEPDKTYLRDSDREELAQQAFSLCVQSLKGQLTKFSLQADLKSNEVERQALKSLMLDIYRAYQRAQKQPNSKQFTNLLVEAYKLVSTTPLTETMNLVDLSMKYCQSLIQTLKQQATQAKQNKKQNKGTEMPAALLPPPEAKSKYAPSTSEKPIHNVADFSNLQMSKISAAQGKGLEDLAYLYKLSALGITKDALWNAGPFQAEFYRAYMAHLLPALGMPPAPKPNTSSRASQNVAKSYVPPTASVSRPLQTASNKPPQPISKSSQPMVNKLSQPMVNKLSQPIVNKLSQPVVASKPSTSTSTTQKISPLAPSMGTVLANLPPSMAANLSSFGGSSSVPTTSQNSAPVKAHQSTSSASNVTMFAKPPLPHQTGSSGKTLQEKLAERQKNLPSMSKVTDLTESLNKLPSSLTVTRKSSAAKQPKKILDTHVGWSRQESSSWMKPTNKEDARKMQPAQRPKPIPSDEVIVLDDD